jgi:hypothetical protein
LEVLLSIEGQTAVAPREHVVQFYADDQALVRRVCSHIGNALSDGEVAIVVATDEHVGAFEMASMDAASMWSKRVKMAVSSCSTQAKHSRSS